MHTFIYLYSYIHILYMYTNLCLRFWSFFLTQFILTCVCKHYKRDEELWRPSQISSQLCPGFFPPGNILCWRHSLDDQWFRNVLPNLVKLKCLDPGHWLLVGAHTSLQSRKQREAVGLFCGLDVRRQTLDKQLWLLYAKVKRIQDIISHHPILVVYNWHDFVWGISWTKQRGVY